MIKECMWKGRSISCSAIFAMQPTDRGMCCSFNKERAEEMFRESRYQEQIVRMTHQDESRSEEDSKLPEWFARLFPDYHLQVRPNQYFPRFESAPEAGISRGLDLILDAHTDLLTASSVTKPIQVKIVILD